MRLTSTGWATVNSSGGVIEVGSTRAEVIARTCCRLEKDSFREAEKCAKNGRVFTPLWTTKTNIADWRKLRRKYGVRAVKIRIMEDQPNDQ
ncbi:MAG: hypothetical protein Unbinned5081contig1001_48 [Prokaryotic dsDNA virus sp.]|nr:MAG: hypothetical protein Unbinned5081contig1001_48 [Prokaryotic dsDNA virus sp.]